MKERHPIPNPRKNLILNPPPNPRPNPTPNPVPRKLSIILAGVVLLLVVWNVFTKHSIIGLDTIAPYFSNEVVLYRIFSSLNFFDYGGLIFNIPTFVFNFLGLPVSWSSGLTVGLSVFLGIAGWSSLLYRIVSGPYRKGKSRAVPRSWLAFMLVLLILLLIGNLITIWLLNQPNLIFLSAFAGIPTCVKLILYRRNSIHNEPGWRTVLRWSYFILGVCLLFVTSLNLVSFFLFIIQVAVIAYVLNHVTKSDKTGIELKCILIRTGAFIGVWIVLVQLLMLAASPARFIGHEISAYFSSARAGEYTESITNDLRASELKNNSIPNILRYATGWMELHTLDNKPVFEFYDVYKSNILFVLIGLTPALVGLAGLPLVMKKHKEIWVLAVVLVTSVILMSKPFLNFVGEIPLIKDGLRWSSSKFFPMLLFSIAGLFVVSLMTILNEYSPKVQKIILLGVSTMLVIYSFPWWTGNVVSSTVQVTIPEEYTSLQEYDENDIILYLPGPQLEYFRSYSWGYFGADFLSYVTKAEVISDSEHGIVDSDYNELVGAYERCDIDELRSAGIDYVVYDRSVSKSQVEEQRCGGGQREVLGENLVVWEVD